MKRSLHFFNGRTKLWNNSYVFFPKFFNPFYFFLFCIFISAKSLLAQETVIYSEGFEANDGNYTVEGGALWEWGTPTYGTTANSGAKCFATNLDGGSGNSTGYITSPAIAIPTLTSDQVARARFYADIDVNMSARGQFMVSPDGITWTVVAQYFMTMQGKWDKYEFDVSDFSGKNLYLRFYLAGARSTDPGFFIDDIAVTVYNKAGDSKLLTLEASESASGSCPWIYPWDGTDYVRDNDIYSVARFTAGEYRDYYKLSKPLVEEGGKYKLEIREVESEESFTDFVDLIAVDHASDVEIAPDNFGNIFAYKPANLVTPVSAVSNTNADVLSLVNQDDEGGFHAYSESFVDLDFGDIDVSEGVRLLLKVKGFNDDGIGTYMPFIGPPAFVVQCQNAEGNWKEVGRLKPRFEWDECMFDLSSYLPDNSGEVKVRLYCISHGQKYHIIDYVAIEAGAEPAKNIIPHELSHATFYENSVTETLNTSDNNYVHMNAGNHIPLEFDATVSTDEKRTFIFVSEGYYIPRGSTYFIYTWDGENWINRDSYSYTNIDETKVFDLSLFLPDPDGEYKVRVWQDYTGGYAAAIDYLDFEVGSLNGTLETAIDVRNNQNVLPQVQSSDNAYFTLSSGFGYTGQRDRWSEYLWKDLPTNYPPSVSNLSVAGSTLSWSYADTESDPQTKVEVEIWSGAGGVGTLIWDPALIDGDQSQIEYNGSDLVNGQEYYFRVKVSDGNNWSAWKEVSFKLNSNPPVANDDSFQSYCGETVSGNVLNNDTDKDGDDFDVAETPTLAYGFFDSFDLETGDFVYRAPLDYAGKVTFSYQATDGALSNSATVSITVSDTLKPVYLGKDTLSYYLTEDTCFENISLTAGQGVEYDLSYSETFASGSSYCVGDPQYDNWGNIRSQIVPSEVVEIQASSSLASEVFVLSDPDMVEQIALAFKEGSYLVLTAPDGNVWTIGTGCQAGSTCANRLDAIELNVNVGGTCSCGGDDNGITFRPCIANTNWGGYGSQTCFAPTQTLNLLIKCSSGPDIHYSDNCSATREQLSGLEDFDYYPVGTTTNTYKLADREGNFIIKDVVIEVIDTISPTLITQDIDVYLDESGAASIEIDDIADLSAIPCDIDTVFADTYNFTCSNIGAQTVMLTARDINGNVSNASAIVTVSDTIAPEIGKDYIVNLDDSGIATLDSMTVANGSSDACDLESIEISKDTFYCDNLGENTVTITATDIHGNSSSSTAIVTVVDHIRPVVMAKDTTLYLDANGIAMINAASVDQGSYDNCSIDTMFLLQDTFDCSYVDSVYVPVLEIVGLKSAEEIRHEGFRVSLITIDASGNNWRTWFYINVLDTISPVLKTKDITVSLDESGTIVLDSLAIDDGSYDACGLAEFKLSEDTFDCGDIGEHNVTMTVTDIHGNASVASAVVTVMDNTGPQVRANNLEVYLDSAGVATIAIADVDAGTTDNCGIDSMYVSLDTFDCSMVGEVSEWDLVVDKSASSPAPSGVEVLLTAVDDNGNSNSESFYVAVYDTIAPVVHTKDIVISLGEDGVESITPMMIVEDSYDACGIESMELSKTSFKGQNVGGNTVELTATDVNGNQAVYTATVTVRDTIAPELWCQNIGINLDADDGQTRIYAAFLLDSVFDAGGIVSYDLDSSRFDCNDLGKHIVELTVTDVGGNTSTCRSEVTVVDNNAPNVICNNFDVVLDEEGFAEIIVDSIDGGTTDACGVAEMELSQRVFTGADLGKNIVTLYATDINGNTDSCNAVITVTDTIAPTAVCNAIEVLVSDANGNELSDEVLAQLAAGSTDNASPFDSLTIEVNPSVFTCDQIGDSVNVEVTVIDEAGNASTCETKVLVGYLLFETELPAMEVSLDSGMCETTIDYPEVLVGESCAELTLVDGLGADGVFAAGTHIETWQVVLGDITDTLWFEVIVSSENLAPTLYGTADTTVVENELVVELTGISDGGDCVAQEVAVSAVSLDSALIETIEVNYEAGSSTAELSIAFTASQRGEAEIVVTVEDEAGATITDTFVVTIDLSGSGQVNNPPVLVDSIADQAVQAGDELSITLSKVLGDVFTDADGDELSWAFMSEIETVYNWMSVSESETAYTIGFEPARADTGCYNIIVQVSDPDGATASDTFEVCVTEITVGVFDLVSGDFEVNMYPNPTRGLVNVELESDSMGDTDVSVSNIAGAEVFRRSYLSGERIQIDLSENVSGMYLIRVAQDGNQVIKKLILDKN